MWWEEADPSTLMAVGVGLAMSAYAHLQGYAAS